VCRPWGMRTTTIKRRPIGLKTDKEVIAYITLDLRRNSASTDILSCMVIVPSKSVKKMYFGLGVYAAGPVREPMLENKILCLWRNENQKGQKVYQVVDKSLWSMRKVPVLYEQKSESETAFRQIVGCGWCRCRSLSSPRTQPRPRPASGTRHPYRIVKPQWGLSTPGDSVPLEMTFS
jgi:hypothetical protein